MHRGGIFHELRQTLERLEIQNHEVQAARADPSQLNAVQRLT